MCLGTKLSDRSLQRYKAKGKKCGYIKVWKKVRDTGKRFIPEYFSGGSLYKASGGLTNARRYALSEHNLIHAFRDKKSAENWNKWNPTKVVIEVIVHPDWVKAIGNAAPELTLTTKAIVMPAYPKRKVTVREFRAAIKGKKVNTYSWEQ